MPCDAACVKIIINGRVIIALAPILQRGGGEVAAAAQRLADAATIQRDLLQARGFSAGGSDEFGGCEQATWMVRWIMAGKCPPGAVHQIDDWTAEIWQQIANLVAGKNLDEKATAG